MIKPAILQLIKAYLDAVIETIEEFQIRRVRWAAEQIERRGEAIEPWKVVTMAGLKPNYSEKVGKTIEQATYKTYLTF